MKVKLLMVLLVATAVGPMAMAQDKPGAREREALRRSQAQLQTLQQAQTALQEKLRLTDEEKAGLEQRVGQAQSRVRAQTRKTDELQTQLDAAQAENKLLQTAKADLEQRLKSTVERVAVLEKDLTQTGARLKVSESAVLERNRQVNSCEKRNDALYGLGRTLVAQCRDTTAVDAAQLVDHASGAKRVAFETLMEDYRDKLDTERLLPADRAQ